MTKQIDTDFFRDLILHCLDYVPVEAKRAIDLPELKTLRLLQSTINFIRSDSYSWFLMLMSSIPPDDWREENITAQVCCINLDDKNEEFLLSCAVLVQLAHFVIMRDECYSYIDVAASSLSSVFKEKYWDRFSGTNDWNRFERYCEITLQRKRKFFQDTGVSCQPGLSSNGKDIFLFWNRTESEIMLQAFYDRHDSFMGPSVENRPFAFTYTSYLKQRIRSMDKSLELRSGSANFLWPSSLRYLGALWRYYSAWRLNLILVGMSRRIHQNPLTWEAQMLDAIKTASRVRTKKNSPVTKNTNCPKAEAEFCLGCVLTASESKVRLNRIFQLCRFLDVFMSRIKVIRDIFAIGKTAFNRVVLTSCLTISRVLKSKVNSLLKLIFYTSGLFGRILFWKRRFVESQPENDSIENVSLLISQSVISTTPRYEVKSAGSIYIAKDTAIKTISSDQDEESSVIALHPEVKSKDKSSTLSKVTANDQCSSNELLGHQSLEKLLNNVQSILNMDLIHRLCLLKETFCSDDMRSSERLICPSCNTKCAMIFLR